jgi:hypothetical protein
MTIVFKELVEVFVSDGKGFLADCCCDMRWLWQNGMQAVATPFLTVCIAITVLVEEMSNMRQKLGLILI